MSKKVDQGIRNIIVKSLMERAQQEALPAWQTLNRVVQEVLSTDKSGMAAMYVSLFSVEFGRDLVASIISTIKIFESISAKYPDMDRAGLMSALAAGMCMGSLHHMSIRSKEIDEVFSRMMESDPHYSEALENEVRLMSEEKQDRIVEEIGILFKDNSESNFN